MSDLVLEQSTLLNAYYDQRVLSSLPNGYGAFFQFGQLDWGYDLIEDIGGSPSVTDIPLDKTSIENVFYTGDAVYNYINGKIVITANVPTGVIPDGDSQLFSCIGIKDTNGNLIAVSATQPIYLYSNRSISVEIHINTARVDAISSAVR